MRSVACEDSVMAAARRLLGYLQWEGVARLAFSVDHEGCAEFYGMRTGWEQASALAIQAGVDFPAAAYQMTRGERVCSDGIYKHPLFSRKPIEDLEWLRDAGGDVARARRPRLLRETVTAVWRILMGQEIWEGLRVSDPVPGMRLAGQVVRRGWESAVRRLLAPFRLKAMMALHTRNMSSLDPRSARGRIMFVCHGNICRSPLAEYLGKLLLPAWSIHSTGLHATPGDRSPARIRKIGRSFGVDLDPHQSTLIDQQAVDGAELILIMDALNYRDFARRFPGALDKLLFLGMFGKRPALSIPDPVDMDPLAAMASADQLARAMQGLVEWLGVRRAE